MLKDLYKVWKIIFPFHKLILIFIFLSILLAATDSIFSVVQGYLLQSLIKMDIANFKYWLIVFAIFNILYWTINYVNDYQYTKKINKNLAQYLRTFSLKKLFSFTISKTIANNSAVRQIVVDQGEGSIRSSIIIIKDIIYDFTLILCAITTVIYYNTILGILNICMFVIIMSWGLWFNKYYKPIREKVIDLWISHNKIKQEAFTHLTLIKSTGQENAYLEKYTKDRGDIVTYSIDKDLIKERHDGRRNYFFSLYFVIFFIITGFIFINGKISVAALYIISANMFYSIIFTRLLYQRISDLIMEHANIKKYLDFVELKNDFDENGKGLQFKNGDINFKNFNFTYPVMTEFVKEIDINRKENGIEEINNDIEEDEEQKTVLQNINFTIKENQKVAFVGHSGSGKSTIIKILLRYYDYDNTQSSITICNQELKDLATINLRQNIGYVEQHVELFDTTLKENILFGMLDEQRKGKSQKEIDEILEEVSVLSRIDAFYDRLGEKKFDTILGEKGIKLSGGERQRVGIARAIIRNPKILILDEATASLDTVNESFIRDAIKKVSKGRTTIIIAHRLSTIMDSDIIFVMDKGQIVGQGKHEELLKNNKYYQELVSGQELK